MHAVRTLLIVVAVAGWVGAQLPKSLREQLADKLPSTRQRAVAELGAMEPSQGIPPALLATALAAMLKDKDLDVRLAAAGFLGAGRPADVAVPALVGAFERVEADAEALRRELSPKGAGDRPPIGLGNIKAMDAYAATLLASLEAYWDLKAVEGVVKSVKAWKIERMSGDTVRRTCVLLCRWRTRPALDAVVDVLTRVEKLPAAPPPAKDKVVLLTPVGADDVAQIIASLEAAVGEMGLPKPAGFNAKAAADWKTLLISNGAKISWKLAESRPASRPASGPVSRPAGDK